MKAYHWTISFETGFVTFITGSELTREKAIEKAKTAPGCRDERVTGVSTDCDYNNWETINLRDVYGEHPPAPAPVNRRKKKGRSSKPIDLFKNVDLLQALDTNNDLGNIWHEDTICTNWILARVLMVAGMRADGKTYGAIGKRLGVGRERIRQLLWKFLQLYAKRTYDAQFE